MQSSVARLMMRGAVSKSQSCGLGISGVISCVRYEDYRQPGKMPKDSCRLNNRSVKFLARKSFSEGMVGMSALTEVKEYT